MRTSKGEELRTDLPDNLVFEDRTPRLVDLSGSGHSNVVTLLSDSRLGASVAVFSLKSSKLRLAAQTPLSAEVTAGAILQELQILMAMEVCR